MAGTACRVTQVGEQTEAPASHWQQSVPRPTPGLARTTPHQYRQRHKRAEETDTSDLPIKHTYMHLQNEPAKSEALQTDPLVAPRGCRPTRTKSCEINLKTAWHQGFNSRLMQTLH
ncbi:Hypothetical predicted protein [Pelobates cultripes]|uniref:Uncharacterized protein n=1 Tax=Pelobates cultripes TaxID=61616 RepID=A0AAD1S102_PELCU|nr:Hypothetical predicted protein [Pelobates cultripes]